MRILTAALTLGVVTALLIAGCGDSSSSGTTATVPAGQLGATSVTNPDAPRRALVLEVRNEYPYSFDLSDDADPTNAKKTWSYPLGRIRGRSTENYVYMTVDSEKTVNITGKAEIQGGKKIELKFAATLKCTTATTCTASGRTSSVPSQLKVTFEPTGEKYLSPSPAGGEGALIVTIAAAS